MFFKQVKRVKAFVKFRSDLNKSVGVSPVSLWACLFLLAVVGLTAVQYSLWAFTADCKETILVPPLIGSKRVEDSTEGSGGPDWLTDVQSKGCSGLQ